VGGGGQVANCEGDPRADLLVSWLARLLASSTPALQVIDVHFILTKILRYYLGYLVIYSMEIWLCWVVVSVIRETRDGWHLPTVGTEVNGDSKGTIKRDPSLVGSLGLTYRYKRFLFCLGCSSRVPIA
jgi:hypothetical protein